MRPRHVNLCLSLAFAAAAVAVPLLPAAGQQTSAISAKEKMEICKFGAQDQKLKGKAEQDFIKKCMANEDAPKKTTKKN